MNRERLQTLRAFLDELPDGHYEHAVMRPECGSACCSLGHCPAIFTDEWPVPQGCSLTTIIAQFAFAEAFFELNTRQSQDLFGVLSSEIDGRMNPTRAQMVARLDRFLS